MKDQFETAVSKGHLDCTDAAALLWQKSIPIGLIKDYFQIIKLNAETIATMVGKEPDELLQALLDKVDNLFDAVPKSDNEKIADFLREIGL